MHQLPNVPSGSYDSSTLSSISGGSPQSDQDLAVFTAPSDARFTVESSKVYKRITEEFICTKCSKVMTGRSVENAEGGKATTSIYQIQPDGDNDDDDAGFRVHLECQDSGRKHTPDHRASKATASISVKCANEKEGQKCNKVLPLNEIEDHWEDNCCFDKVGGNLHEKFRQIRNQRQDISKLNGRLNNLEERQTSTDENVRENAGAVIKLGVELTNCIAGIEEIRMIVDTKGCNEKYSTDIKKKLECVQGLTAKCMDEGRRIEAKLSGLSQNYKYQQKDITDLKKNISALASKDARAESPRPGMALVAPQQDIHKEVADVQLRCRLLETASYDGTLLWKIVDFARRKQEAVSEKTLSLFSQPFYTSRYGYKMCARIYLNGDGMGKFTHCSLFFTIMKGDFDALLEWPFKQKVTMMMYDQETGKENLTDSFRPDARSVSFARPTKNMNTSSGCPLFVSEKDMLSGKYVRDDTLFIKYVVDTSDLFH